MNARRTVLLVVATFAIIALLQFQGVSEGGVTGEATSVTTVAKNPCTSEDSCVRCMSEAEASGSTRKGTIPSVCQQAVMCAVKNRVLLPGHKPKVKSYCGAVSQKTGKVLQFSPYKCVGDKKYANQKYCDCCKRKKSTTEISIPTDQVCKQMKANSFNNAGMNSWASRNCQRVTNHPLMSQCVFHKNGQATTTPVFDFYVCRG